MCISSRTWHMVWQQCPPISCPAIPIESTCVPTMPCPCHFIHMSNLAHYGLPNHHTSPKPWQSTTIIPIHTFTPSLTPFTVHPCPISHQQVATTSHVVPKPLPLTSTPIREALPPHDYSSHAYPFHTCSPKTKRITPTPPFSPSCCHLSR